jgi:hypothetical protein
LRADVAAALANKPEPASKVVRTGQHLSFMMPSRSVTSVIDAGNAAVGWPHSGDRRRDLAVSNARTVCSRRQEFVGESWTDPTVTIEWGRTQSYVTVMDLVMNESRHDTFVDPRAHARALRDLLRQHAQVG